MENTADDTQPGASPARQMLETLALAAKEMTRKIEEVQEQALKLNTALEARVAALLAEIAEQYEELIQKQLTGLSVDSNALLGELIEVRREELEVLNKLCEEMRTQLRSELYKIGPAIKEQSREKLSGFSQSLSETEKDVSQSVTLLRMALNENLQQQLAALAEDSRSDIKALEHLSAKQLNFLNDEIGVNSERLQVKGRGLKDEFKAAALRYVKSVQQRVEELKKTQAEELELRLSEFSSSDEKLKPMLQANMDFTEKVSSSFALSCQETSQLRLDLHESMSENLTRAYRAEISSLAQQTEDKIAVVQSQVNLALTEQLSRYIEQSGKLLSEFEENSAKSRNDTSRIEELPEDESVEPILEKVIREIQKAVSDAGVQAKEQMEREVSELRSKLMLAGQKSSEQVERSFAEYSKTSREIAQSHNEDLDELRSKCDALEQLLGDSRDIQDTLEQLS